MLEILRCGPGATMQDLGRTGYRRHGVSTAGAMDRASLALANALVGNPAESAVLEFPLLGARLRLAEGPALVAACGAGASLRVAGRTVPAGMSARVAAGEEIDLGAARSGVYTCLAVSGGLALPPVLGSRATHRRSGIGPPSLSAGDRLPLGAAPAPAAPLRYRGAAPPGSGAIRVVPGPQDAQFGPAVHAAFLSEPFRTTPRSDRMGLRLEGPPLPALGGHDIVSEGVVPGSIQVPGDGQPIVLGRDCQTTGGYPKIATVISADLDRLAQLRPGAELRFRAVSRDEAVAAAREMAAWIAGLASRIEPADSA